MAKFCGKIGYGIMVPDDWPWDPFSFETGTTDNHSGIWEEHIVEKPAVGDLMQNTRRWQGREELHDDLVINNKVSIVMDAYASAHFFDIRYVTWRGTRWKVSNVEVQHPRLILTLGEVYHGPKDGSPDEIGAMHEGSRQ